MKRLIELTDDETTLANEIYRMIVGHPEVEETIRRRGFVDLRFTTAHFCKLINLLIDNSKEVIRDANEARGKTDSTDS